MVSINIIFVASRKITAEKSREILQKRAKEVLSTYEWGRFKTLAESIDKRMENREGNVIVTNRVIVRDLIVPTLDLAGFESAYKDFLSWLIRPDGVLSQEGSQGEKPHPMDDIRAPRIFKHHPNSFFREFYRTDHNPDYLLSYIAIKAGEEIVGLLCGLMDEVKVTRRHAAYIYWPELEKLWICDLIDRMGEDEFRKALLKRVPQYPPELHDSRMRVLEDTLKILNAFYPPAREYFTRHNLL